MVATAALAACGSGEGGSGARAINWYVFNEPGGAYDAGRGRLQQAGRRQYKINYVKLPTDANQQRELIVRRLAAEDDTSTSSGMDVIWTAEFAEAGWILPWEGERRAVAEKDKLEGPLKTVEYKGKIWAIPFTSNTQLLWYRKDRVDAAARGLHLGRDDRRRGRPEGNGDRGPGRASTRASRSGSTR